MNFRKHYQSLIDADPRPEDGSATGSIQWKGTEACLDLHCKCGYSDHLDDDFTYYWRCCKCKTVYALSEQIRLIPMNEEQVKYIEKELSSSAVKGELPQEATP